MLEVGILLAAAQTVAAVLLGLALAQLRVGLGVGLLAGAVGDMISDALVLGLFGGGGGSSGCFCLGLGLLLLLGLFALNLGVFGVP